KHIVTVLSLRLRHIDLDAVVKVEQPLGTIPVPHDRIERTQQRPAGDGPRRSRLPVTICGIPPARYQYRFEYPLRNQLVNRPARLTGAQSVVVPQIRLRGDAVRSGRARRQLADRIRLIRFGTREDRRGNHPFSEVVSPLEADSGGRAEFPDREQPLTHPLHLGAVPPTTLARARLDPERVLQRSRSDRAQFPHGLQHLLRELRRGVGYRVRVGAVTLL